MVLVSQSASRTATLLALLTPGCCLSTISRVDPSAVAIVSTREASGLLLQTRCSPLLHSLLSSFQGHFDNHAQMLEDQANGFMPRQGGGHEHIHCHLQPVPLVCSPNSVEACVLGTYYFDGRPQAVFRERLYRLDEVHDDHQFGHCVRMRIYRLREEVEATLRNIGGDASQTSWSRADVNDSLYIPDCDVFWRYGEDRFEGAMRSESALVFSPTLGKQIVVKDDVTLWEDALWVNDRGTDIDGNYLYGNIRSIPYKMLRVPNTHWTVTGRCIAVN